MVARTQRLRVLRTLQRQAWLKPSTGVIVRRGVREPALYGGLSPRSWLSTALRMFSVFALTVFCTSFARPSCCVSGSNTVFAGGGDGSGLWCDEHPKMDITASETAETPKMPIATP